MTRPPLKQIRRIDLPTRAEFVERWLPLDEPLIITNAVPNWRAKREWSLDWFKAQYGDRTIAVEKGSLFEFERERLTLAEFIARAIEASNAEPMYWSEGRVFELFPELREHVDLDRPDLFNRALMSAAKIYIGPSDAFSPIHYDRAPNLTAQIVGRKRWIFFAPSETDLLYPYPWRHFLGHFSKINSQEKLTDFATFPLFERAQAWDAVVEPGDMIYVPVGWWHHVTSLTPTISLHFFWKTWPQYAAQVLSKPLYALLGKTPQSDVKLTVGEIRWLRRLRALLGKYQGNEAAELARIDQKLADMLARVKQARKG